MALFGNDEKAIKNTLEQMVYEARSRTNYNQTETYRKVREWADNERRLDNYDKDKLVKKLEETKQSGAYLDLEECLRGRQDKPSPKGGGGTWGYGR